MALLPDPSPFAEPYWEGARAGELRLQRCGACAAVWHPPLPRCPSCRSARVEWRACEGGGELHSYTVVMHSAHPDIVDQVPYVVAVVQLDEGPRVVANLVGCRIDQLAIGMRVRTTFQQLTADVTLPQFTAGEPASGGETLTQPAQRSG
jgi:uncharacterized OB-fold protein